ncbi:AAA family ATPase [Shewanella chilikensis]|uniref:AAA family ATPase n=1 Tax=Shewanella chilikensis TaxID=558541 RepID=UPI00200DE83A|nr:AAA family ATPase [Shewanella chilikensis]MCL1162491.1 AAA family ATPase [Shewanella chilikensis]
MNNVVAIEQQATQQQVIQMLKPLLEEGCITQSQLAKEIGNSGAVISQYLKGNYGGDVDAVTEKLSHWLNMRKTRNSQIVAPGFVETQTAKQILNALNYAHAAELISVVFGASGVGKSTTCRQYINSNNNCWMITASPAVSGIGECLYEIALELGMDDAPKRKGSLSRAIKRRLTGTGGLLIVDEADHLDYPSLEALRILQEQTGIGMVLVGNNRVYSQLTGGRRNEDFARLFSRVSKKVGIHKAKQNDVNAIANAWQISDQPARNLLQKIAERPGALRNLNQVLRLAATMANGVGKAIDEALIKQAFRELEGDVQ